MPETKHTDQTHDLPIPWGKLVAGGLTDEDRMLIRALVVELKRRNDLDEAALIEPDVLLSCKQAADYLGVSPSAVSHMIEGKRLTKVCRRGRSGILLKEIKERYPDRVRK